MSDAQRPFVVDEYVHSMVDAAMQGLASRIVQWRTVRSAMLAGRLHAPRVRSCHLHVCSLATCLAQAGCRGRLDMVLQLPTLVLIQAPTVQAACLGLQHFLASFHQACVSDSAQALPVI